MYYYEIIDKDTLKPGDTVGIRIGTHIGFTAFRYPRIVPRTIKRITPARTKFVMTDGSEFSKNEVFYLITPEVEHNNYIAECVLRIADCLGKFEELRRRGKLYSQDDEFIEKAAKALETLCKDISW